MIMNMTLRHQKVPNHLKPDPENIDTKVKVIRIHLKVIAKSEHRQYNMIIILDVIVQVQ